MSPTASPVACRSSSRYLAPIQRKSPVRSCGRGTPGRSLRFTRMYTPRMRASVVAFLLAVGSVGLLAESAGGIRWTAPAEWKTGAPRPMRAATYSVATVAGDQGISECIVNYFGPGQGGGIDANIERWKGQVQGPDGKPAPANVEKRTVHGLPVVVIDTAGSYTGLGGPLAASAKPVPGYRLLGAIVEGPGGTVFFKLTGPSKTIARHEKNFNALLDSIQPDR